MEVKAMETTDRRTILLVDDNATNLTAGKNMLSDRYKVYPIPTAEIMFDLLENITPDMILLDIEMPEMDGYEAIKKLKRNPVWEDIPVIFLTAKADETSELEGLTLGAVDYIYKPFSAPLLLKRIENHLLIQRQKRQFQDLNTHLEEMVKKRTQQVSNLQNAVLNTVANLVEFRDDVTGGHVTRTQRYLEILVNQLIKDGVYAEEVSGWNLDYLIPSAQLHDVGKIIITDSILNKPGALTKDEFEVMKTHAEAGVKAIKKIEENAEEHDFMRHARRIAGGHHEKWDGTGYPAGLKGTDIPLEARLMAIADVYDALVSKRPYKNPLGTDEAKQVIEGGRGTHFDPVLVDVFSEVADQFAETLRNSAY
jgi:putative two-component system response regulator